jgi:hypothetical protein
VGVEEPAGETVAVSGTGPEKRLNAFIVIFEVPDLLGSMVTLPGVAFRVKLGAQNWPAKHEILQPVSACNSHPEKEWPCSVA